MQFPGPSTPRQSGILSPLQNMPLVGKLVLAFGLVIIATSAALVTTSTQVSSRQLTESAGQAVAFRAEELGQHVSDLLDLEIVSRLQVLGFNRILQDNVASINQAYEGSSEEIAAQLLALDTRWQAAPDRDPLIFARLNHPIASELKEFASGFPENVEIFVTDQYGGLVATTNRTSDYLQADEDWWQGAWNGGAGNVFIGQPEFDASANTLSVIVSIPLTDHRESATANVIGIIRTTVNLNALAQVVNAARFGETGRADLYLPGGERIGLVDNLPVLEPGDPALLDYIANPPGTAFGAVTLQGAEQVVSALPIAAITESPYLANLGWTLVVYQSSAEALAPIATATATALTTAAIVFVLTVLVAAFIAYQLARPITQLSRVSQQLAAGDFSQRAPIYGQDEIGRLATQFNAMAEQLEDTVGKLESRIEDRTRDLRTVSDVNTQIATILEPRRLLQDVVDLTKERFGLYHSHIYQLNAAGDTLELAAGAGYVGREMVAQKRQIALENVQSIVATAGRERKGVIINDTHASATFLPHPLLPNTRSEMAVPLISRGQVLGVLDVQSDQPGYFTEDVLETFELMAAQIATAISNARLYEEADRTSRHDRAITEIDRRMQGALGVDEILQTTVRELGKALRVPYTAIELKLPKTNGEHADAAKEN